MPYIPALKCGGLRHCITKKRKECLESLRWIPTKILKKMAICEKLDLKPKYPHNMHPAIKQKKHKEKESDSPEIT